MKPEISWKRVYGGIRRRLMIDTHADGSRTLLLAGSARSGTTWLAEVLTAENDFRYMFEPFRPNGSGTAPKLSRRYVRPGDSDPEVRAICESVFSGRGHSAWIDGQNRQIVVRRRLVKEIRINLLLPWIEDGFAMQPRVLALSPPRGV